MSNDRRAVDILFQIRLKILTFLVKHLSVMLFGYLLCATKLFGWIVRAVKLVPRRTPQQRNAPDIFHPLHLLFK